MPTMYFSRRKRLEKLAADDAAGKLVWSRDFDAATRALIMHALQDASQQYMLAALRSAHATVLREVGAFRLAKGQTADDDLFRYMQTCDAEHFVTCIEALYDAIKIEAVGQPDPWGHIEISRWNVKPDAFEESVNTIMREHQIGYEMIGGRIIDIDSQSMHVAVVKPALTLLSGRKEYREVEAAYADALDQVASGDAANAITDAGRALQQMLTAEGCQGDSIGRLLASAQKRRLFGSHDYPLLTVVEKAVSWVGADRSEMGDTHKAGADTLADAWLTIHVVGALILRIAAGRRGRKVKG
jgi:AbiJ-like protein